MQVNKLLRAAPSRIAGRFGARAVVALLALYWVNILVLGNIGVVQLPLGVALALFAPGFVLTRLTGVNTERTGVHIASIVGASVVVVALSAIGSAAMLTAFGAERTFTFRPLAATLTGVLLALLALLYARGGSASWGDIGTFRVRGGEAALLCLPVLGVVAAALIRQYGSNLGSFAFVTVLAITLVVFWYRSEAGRAYPLGVFAVSLALLLHTNFTSPHIVGADIQGLYAIANHAFLTESWFPALAGFGGSIPVMTAVPAAVAMLLGAPLLVTFKLLFVFLFALAPVGLYYVSEDVFDPDIAFFSASFFALYHLSFAFTPGKQLVAETFAVLALFALSVDSERATQPALLVLFSAGMVFSHYGVTYVFAISLLVASILLAAARQVRMDITGRIPLAYPVVLLAAASVWYALTAPALAGRIAAIPAEMLAQLSVLFSGGAVERSGVTYVATEATLLQYLNILLYGVLVALIAVGLAHLLFATFLSRPVLAGLRSRTGGDGPVAPEYVALALPAFLFLGSSFVFVLGLWADRVLQLALVVLAPLVPLGYRAISRAMPSGVTSRVTMGRAAPLVALLVALLLFSSGFAGAAVGDASTSTFDASANDLSFEADDLRAVEWLRTNPDIERSETAPAGEDGVLSVDHPERVQVYTDPGSYQLLRSTLSPRYYTVELVQLKNQWQPSVTPERVGSGYVLLREEAIVDTPDEGPVPSSVLTESEASQLRERGTVVYNRDGVQIVRVVDDGEA